MKKGPTFLKVYLIPVLLLNILMAVWSIVATYTVHGWFIYIGYAVIVTIGFYLYLMYLNRSLF